MVRVKLQDLSLIRHIGISVFSAYLESLLTSLIAESAYLDKWIQKQIDLICTDGIGQNLHECKELLKDAESLARNLIGKEERITAFGELCQEIMSSGTLHRYCFNLLT